MMSGNEELMVLIFIKIQRNHRRVAIGWNHVGSSHKNRHTRQTKPQRNPRERERERERERDQRNLQTETVFLLSNTKVEDGLEREREDREKGNGEQFLALLL